MKKNPNKLELSINLDLQIMENRLVFKILTDVYLTQTEINLNCPYKEYSFLPEDAENFFGRDEVVKKLFNAVEKNNFVPVLGESKGFQYGVYTLW